MKNNHVKRGRNEYGQFLKNFTPLNKGKKGGNVCKIEGCNKKHCALGFCDMHYYRLKRTGTTEDGTGNNGKVRSEETKMKMRLSKLGEKHPAWKGDNVGYAALHDWLKYRLGVPNHCSHCGTTTAKKFEWANISGKYKRDIRDFKRLCTSCHMKFDNRDHRTTWGENHYLAKLTEEDVLEVRKLSHKNIYTQNELSKIYKITRQMIGRIINRKAWRHV